MRSPEFCRFSVDSVARGAMASRAFFVVTQFQGAAVSECDKGPDAVVGTLKCNRRNLSQGEGGSFRGADCFIRQSCCVRA